MSAEDLTENPPHGVPCRVLVLDGRASLETAAKAIRLDRKGAVIRLVGAAPLLALQTEAQILVSFELPHNPALPGRLLCFYGTVRHFSMENGYKGWMGVSFREAAICQETSC